MLKKTLTALALSFTLTLLMVSSVAITAYAADEQKTQGTMALSPAPQGQMALKSPPGDAEPIHNPAGSEMFVPWLTIVPVCD